MAATGVTATVSHDERRIAFRDLVDNDGRYETHGIGDPVEALAVIQYTGDTTGKPKGAMLTHANLTAACAQYVEIAMRAETKPLEEGKERSLCVLPLYRIYALLVNLLLGLKIGAEIVLHQKFDPAAAVSDITRKKITAYAGVPFMHVAILNLPGIEAIDLTSLKFCLSGGTPLPVAVQQAFGKLTGCRFHEGWGMSETSLVGTFTPNMGPVKPGSCGIPLPGVEIKVVDAIDPTREVATAERGEICIKGPNVMKGYWKKPDETANAMTADGFFRTGDVGFIDDDGYVYIVDRTKDMLLVGGINVYLRDIEEAIYQHPSVEEVAVIGVTAAHLGDTLKAFVKLKAGAPPLGLDDLKTFLKAEYGTHEMIGSLEVLADSPKTVVSMRGLAGIRAESA